MNILSLCISCAATMWTLLLAIEVLSAMHVRRSGLTMWAAWMGVALASWLALLQWLTGEPPPSLYVAVLLLASAWESWGFRKRFVWRAFHGGTA